MVTISVITGTLNRLQYLKPMLESVRLSCGDLAREIIVVDGGSTDGTLDYLQSQTDVITIAQGSPLGAVKAFNAGFRAATGEYVANLNDDLVIAPGTLERACEYLDKHPRCGQVAIPFAGEGGTPETQILPNWLSRMIHQRNIPYANFGVTRKVLGDRLGWWGDRLYHYAGDCKLSFEIWREGYTVDVLREGFITHYQVYDETRKPNVETHRLAEFYDPTRAWEIERRQEKQELQHHSKTTGKIGVGVKLRYLGNFHSPATYAQNPSGNIYRFQLKPRAVFRIDQRDLKSFMRMRTEGNSPLWEQL